MILKFRELFERASAEIRAGDLSYQRVESRNHLEIWNHFRNHFMYRTRCVTNAIHRSCEFFSSQKFRVKTWIPNREFFRSTSNSRIGQIRSSYSHLDIILRWTSWTNWMTTSIRTVSVGHSNTSKSVTVVRSPFTPNLFGPGCWYLLLLAINHSISTHWALPDFFVIWHITRSNRSFLLDSYSEFLRCLFENKLATHWTWKSEP